MKTKDMACHTWALSGNPEKGKTIHQNYVSLSDDIGEYYQYGENLKGKSLVNIQQETIERIATLCETRTMDKNHIVYLCGGFRKNQVCPEHLWLEDHTTGKTYDTFINQEVRVVDRIGVPGQPFQPGCEAAPFLAHQIARIQINGYTTGQYNSLP